MNEKSQMVVCDDGSFSIHREKPSRKIKGPVKWIRETAHGPEWETENHYGCLKKWEDGSPLGGGPWAILSVSNKDETARHDWREFQQLKNLLLGEEWEGLELYPSESRLKDPSNRFYLFCFPAGVVPFGLPGGRLVLDMDEAQAPQRPFPG